MSEVKDKPAIWTGWLKRGETQGTVQGEITDQWGWSVYITGTLDKENGGYRLEGRLGPPPDSLRVPIVDDPVAASG